MLDARPPGFAKLAGISIGLCNSAQIEYCILDSACLVGFEVVAAGLQGAGCCCMQARKRCRSDPDLCLAPLCSSGNPDLQGHFFLPGLPSQIHLYLN